MLLGSVRSTTKQVRFPYDNFGVFTIERGAERRSRRGREVRDPEFPALSSAMRQKDDNSLMGRNMRACELQSRCDLG